MNKAQILKAVKSGQALAFGKRDSYGAPRMVRVLGEEKMPTHTYGGPLADERDWPLRWKVQQIEDALYNGALLYEAGDIAWAKSQELLGDWATVEAERTARREQGQAQAQREQDALQKQRDAADKIKELFAAVGSPARIDHWNGSIQIRPTDLYDFLERLGKTTVRGLVADAREHFAPDISEGDPNYDHMRGVNAAIDYIEESVK